MNDDNKLVLEEELGIDEDDDENQEMEELALNSNFDPGLLDCWPDDEDEAAAVTNTNTASNSLPSSLVAASSATMAIPRGMVSVSSSDRSSKTNVDSLSTGNMTSNAPWGMLDKSQQALLMAVTSVSRQGDEIPSLPPFGTTTSGTLMQQHPSHVVPSQNMNLQQHNGNHVPYQPVLGAQQQQQQIVAPFAFSPVDSAALLPLAINALAAGVDLSKFFSSDIGRGAAFVGMHNSPAMATPVAATSVVASTAGSNPTPTATASVLVPPTKSPPPDAVTASNKRKRGNDGDEVDRKVRGRGKQQQEEDEDEEPSSMLFDAPAELRLNFMQSQGAHGLPQTNSYHFARSTLPTSSAAPISSSLDPVPRLADTRQGVDDITGSKRIKNAKEQKRAQRITELIEQLRVRMEKGGWKVGIKSKLHTLSSCSDYVKHLLKVTKEKETAVAQARSDLEAKRRKIEEEKASQQDPSEPESTTSSLTTSSGLRSADKKNGDEANKGTTQEDQTEKSKSELGGSSKDQRSSTYKIEPPEKTLKRGDGGAATSEDSDASGGEKRKLSSHESNNSEEYPSSVEHEDRGEKKRADGVGQHVSIGPVSSVSDVTYNNKYSKGSSATSSSDDITMSATMGANGSSSAGETSAIPSKDAVDVCPSAQNTVCSDAAVAETLGPDKDHSPGDCSNSRDADNRDPAMAIETITTSKTTSSHHHHHHHRKRKLQQELSKIGMKMGRDASSKESSFLLDYEEVFLKSNVPQIIASTTGRIVAFNDIFLRASSLNRNQVERLTIFSLVQTTMLSNLFELVASSLREEDLQVEKKSKGTRTPLQNYSTMTLPCVPFHADRPSLFMTITLMTDEDVKKRCFHCVFTDNAPGANGSVGSVTPQLLASLFQPLGTNQGQSSSSGGSSGKSTDTKVSSKSGKNSDFTSDLTSNRSGDNFPRHQQQKEPAMTADHASSHLQEQVANDAGDYGQS